MMFGSRGIGKRTVISALCLASTIGVSRTDAQSTDRETIRLVREMASALRTTAHLPGLSIAVGRDGKILFAEGFGYADVEARRPVTTTTQFRTASVGKVITATALGRLVQERRVNLDAPVQTYVPSFPEKAWPITPRQLAGHVAGMPHYNAADKVERRFYPSVTDALTVFSAESLLFEPGTRYSYSTHGFTLLSAVIEGASGKPFLQYLHDAVLTPLGMKSTGPNLIARPGPKMATLYTLSGTTPVKVSSPEDPSYKWAGGGLVSTPSDLVRLAGAYTNGNLSPETVDMMFESQRLQSGKETGVGIAWRSGYDVFGQRTLEHAGSMEGTRTVVALYPDSRFAVALMTNTDWNSLIEETAHMIALPFLFASSPAPQPTGTAEVTITVAKANGTKEVKTGALSIGNGRGSLVVDPGSPTQLTYPLIYLERGNSYAMVRPDGIVHLTMAVEADSVVGRAIGYGSPRLTPPSSDPPFFTFRGSFVRTKVSAPKHG